MRAKTTIILLIQMLFLNILESLPAFAEKACVKNSLGKVVCGDIINGKKAATQKSNSKKKAKINPSGVDLKLEGCTKSTEGLLCSLTIYNSTDYDKRFKIYANWLPEMSEYRSILIDSEGNEYAATLSGMGSTLGPRPGIGGGFSQATLPPKLKTKALLLFRPNGRLSDFIRTLKVSVEVENRRYYHTFRDFNAT
jgi:hypothetical protein